MKKDVIITGKNIVNKKTTEEEYIEAVTSLWDNLSEDERIKTGRPKMYRKPTQEIKGRPRKKRRHRR